MQIKANAQTYHTKTRSAHKPHAQLILLSFAASNPANIDQTPAALIDWTFAGVCACDYVWCETKLGPRGAGELADGGGGTCRIKVRSVVCQRTMLI